MRWSHPAAKRQAAARNACAAADEWVQSCARACAAATSARCDDSPNFGMPPGTSCATEHPVIQSFEPGGILAMVLYRQAVHPLKSVG
ncbi:hypothetical protein ACU4GD_37760 [Cupriavidus basilensis]